MFIRSKTISGRNYAYLVRTKWDKKKKAVRQKVSKYLGPILYLEKSNDVSFFEYYNSYNKDKYLNEVAIKNLVRDLVELELFRHGFLKKSSGVMSNESYSVNPETVPRVFSLNEGYMNRYTLREIENYSKILDSNESKIPYKFASLFVNAGLAIDKDMFIELYQRFFSDKILKDED